MKKALMGACAGWLLQLAGGYAVPPEGDPGADEIRKLNETSDRETLLKLSGAGGPAPSKTVRPGELDSLSSKGGAELRGLSGSQEVKQWCGTCGKYLGVTREGRVLNCPHCEGTGGSSDSDGSGGGLDFSTAKGWIVLLALIAGFWLLIASIW